MPVPEWRIQKLVETLRQRDLLQPLEKVCRDAHTSLREVLGDSRRSDIVRAREACIMYLREEHGFSYPTIGALLDRDHTTVMAAYHRVRERAERAEPKA